MLNHFKLKIVVDFLLLCKSFRVVAVVAGFVTFLFVIETLVGGLWYGLLLVEIPLF